MFKKETEDEKYRNDPFRAVNFKIDNDGVLDVLMAKRCYFHTESLLKTTNTADRKKYTFAKIAKAVHMRNNAKRPIKTEQSALTKN